MEGSSSSSHEEERTVTFSVHHPCYFLQQALRALLKCLGIESQEKGEKTSPPQTPAADPPSIANPTTNIGSSTAIRGSRRAPISHGSGPEHN